MTCPASHNDRSVSTLEHVEQHHREFFVRILERPPLLGCRSQPISPRRSSSPLVVGPLPQHQSGVDKNIEVTPNRIGVQGNLVHKVGHAHSLATRPEHLKHGIPPGVSKDISSRGHDPL